MRVVKQSTSTDNSFVRICIGVDVQVLRGCAWYACDRNRNYIDSGWFEATARSQAQNSLFGIVDHFSQNRKETIAVGIDAPRHPLARPRDFFWDRKHCTWRKRRPGGRGYGRHCEVVIKALNLGNPQWTPLAGEEPDWMALGCALFQALSGFSYVYQVFPTASLWQLENDSTARMNLSFKQFRRGPKDMLDAAVASLTVLEFVLGNGTAVGGGDGLGTIVLPRPAEHELLESLENWPVLHG